MRRRSRAGGQPVKARRRKAVTLKRGNAPKAVRRRDPATADLQEQLDRRTRELHEALEQQAATADVLKVISRSTFDLHTVLDTLLKSAVRLCDADAGTITQRRDNVFYRSVSYGLRDALAEYIKDIPVKPGRDTCTGRALLEGRAIHIHDVEADPEYTFKEAQRLGAYRTMLGVPMLREGVPVGVLTLSRSEVRPFSDKQVKLVTTFADQAAIAIENVRLFEAEQERTRELSESLQQQTATADVLKVISRSTFDLPTVLDTLAESATRLCSADNGVIFQRDVDLYRFAANYGFSPEAVKYAREHPLRPSRSNMTGRVALEGRPIHIPDVLADPEYRATEYQRVFGYRTNLGVPLLREGSTIGIFSLTRNEVKPFNENQIELVRTFADQAVIAIENSRLLNELRESLQQQTATADVLKVISRSTFDLQTVLDTLVESAACLCEADVATGLRIVGSIPKIAASYGLTPELQEQVKAINFQAGRGSVAGRALLEGNVVHVHDVRSDPEYTMTAAAEMPGARTSLGVPLLREGVTIGLFVLMRRTVRPFTEQQIELLSTFADQAVIAIENTRLFEAEQRRTRELSESLQQQTATSDVLRVISSSPTEFSLCSKLLVSELRNCAMRRLVAFPLSTANLSVWPRPMA
jgi:two-component system, NtrC family, sensor kinase